MSNNINIRSTVEDTKGIKTDAIVTINYYDLKMKVAGPQSKGIKWASQVIINNEYINVSCIGQM